MEIISDPKHRFIDAVRELIWTGSYGSTTIDQICEKAGVKKGSFYYFFDSKATLAEAALDAEWQKKRVALDQIFSPTVPPLDRFRRFYEYIYNHQSELRAKCGCVLGCPLFALGSEVCTQEPRLGTKVQELLGYWRRYLESAIRDAHAAGLIDAPDAEGKARMLFAYQEGMLTQARIQNDLAVLREMERGTVAMLGVTQNKLAAA
jgi:TetR/AcrR family transcriptional repressor of nem operon